MIPSPYWSEFPKKPQRKPIVQFELTPELFKARIMMTFEILAKMSGYNYEYFRSGFVTSLTCLLGSTPELMNLITKDAEIFIEEARIKYNLK